MVLRIIQQAHWNQNNVLVLIPSVHFRTLLYQNRTLIELRS